MSTEIKIAPRRFFASGKGTSTPWGRADSSTKLAPGVMWYDTPGHGGLSVTRRWALDNLTLPAQYLAMFWGSKLWFEEDCKCALVFHEHPELWNLLVVGRDPSVSFAESIRRWDPDYFDPTFRERCREAGYVPDLLFLQPEDQIRISGQDRTFKVIDEWTGRGSGRCRVIRYQDARGLYQGFRLTTADVQGRLLSIERAGSVVWERPTETPLAVTQAANG